jgi:hypothetical protein
MRRSRAAGPLTRRVVTDVAGRPGVRGTAARLCVDSSRAVA